MNKRLAIFLLASILAPFAGIYVYLEYKMLIIKEEAEQSIRSGLPEKDIVLIKLSLVESKKKLIWKHDREFEFEDHMYDIVDINLVGDTVMIACYKDIKETVLKDQVEKIMAEALGHDPVHQNQTQQLKNFFQSGFQKATFNWKPAEIPFIEISYKSLNFNLSSVNLSPPVPPPKSA